MGTKTPNYRRRMWSDGRVTIPAAIRKRLRLTPGAEVEFFCAGDGELIITRKPGQADEIRMSNDELMALLRPYDDDDNSQDAAR